MRVLVASNAQKSLDAMWHAYRASPFLLAELLSPFPSASSVGEPDFTPSRRRNMDFARRKSALARDHGTRRIRSSWWNLALLQPVQDRKVGWRRAKGVSNRNSGTVTNFTAVSRTGIVAWMAAWVRRLSQGAAIRVTKCPKRPAANVPRVMSSNASHE